MNPAATLQNYLVVGAILFGLGMIGFLARRNFIVMFLSAEMMLQGVAINLVAFGRYRGNLQGQVFVLFVLTVAACVLSCLVLIYVTGNETRIAPYYVWFQTGNVDVGFTLRADALTAIMLVTVTFISSVIAIYSAGYMHGDPGYARYFAEIALFIFSMTGLVMADNLLVLYAFWEGVGLCSYLLIGFWFTKPAAAAAARKAFLVTRIGDLGFILG